MFTVTPILTQQLPTKGLRIGIFKQPNSHNIETHMSSKLYSRLQPDFAQKERPLSDVRGWSQVGIKQIQE